MPGSKHAANEILSDLLHQFALFSSLSSKSEQCPQEVDFANMFIKVDAGLSGSLKWPEV